MDPSQIIGISLGLGTLAVLAGVAFIRTNVVLCQPNELVVIAGRRHKRPDGSTVGYRVLRGGRGFKWPLVESVARLPLTTVPIEVELKSALCKGMIPVRVSGRANVKLAGSPERGSDAAIERFLGKSVTDVVKTSQQTLEGALRGVIATVSPEDANAERLRLAKEVAEHARADLKNLGIELDFFQIQDVSDAHGYLEAIGRKRNAAVQRDARIAEATAEAEARSVAAEQDRVGRQAEIDAQLSIIEKENALDVRRSELAGNANQAEQKARMAGDITRAQQKVLLEDQHIELARRKAEADTVVPARAQAQARQLEAEGSAARIREDGRATAEAIELMRSQWDDGAARELFLIRLMPELTDKVTRVVSENLQVDKLTILDGGSGEGLPNYVKNLTNSAVVMMEQVKNATGIDMARLAEERRPETLPRELD